MSGGTGAVAVHWEVRGGAGGVRARGDDLLALARTCAAVADVLADAARDLAAAALDPELAAGAVLSPGTAVAAEDALLRAARLLLGAAWSAGELAARLRLALQTYRGADAVLHGLVQAAATATGAVVGAAAPLVVLPLATAVVVDAAVHGRPVAAGGLASRAADEVLGHPRAVEALAAGAAGVLDGVALWFPPALLLAAPGSYGGDAAAVSALLPERTVVVRRVGGSAPRPAATSPAELLRDLAGDPALHPGGGATLTVTRLVGPDGQERWVVGLPGTVSWSPRAGAEPRDLTSDVRLVARRDNAYADGVVLALRRAGVPPGAQLLLVGHSEGGLVATALAADPRMRRYDVEAVLVAGAPAARMPASGAAVLALEGTADPVPALDGLRNPDRPRLTTARFSGRGGASPHGLDTYAAAAAQLPVGDPSVAGWLAVAGPWLAPGSSAETSRWSVRRVGPRAAP